MDENVKVKIVKKYNDLMLEKTIEKDEVIEVTRERSKQLIIANVAEKYVDNNYDALNAERNRKAR